MLKKRIVSKGNTQKLYVQLYCILRELIESGEWPAGTMIPSEKELRQAYGISNATVKTALSHLSNQGFLVRKQGKGTFVNDRIKEGMKVLQPEARLIGEISNEVNNPLAVIGEKAGWMEDLMAEEDRGLIKNYDEYVDVIMKIKLQVSRAGKVTHGMTELPQKILLIEKTKTGGGKKGA
ncbi:MAG: GntR family transcriptional regulator [Nitrospirota bacterium]